jgi:hypothetical protein
MHEIEVRSVSPEEKSDGIAELWAGGELIAFTRIEDGDLMLRIDTRRPKGSPVVVGVHGLTVALAEVGRVLAVH